MPTVMDTVMGIAMDTAIVTDHMTTTMTTVTETHLGLDMELNPTFKLLCVIPIDEHIR